MPLAKSAFIPIPQGAAPGFDHADIYHDGSGASRMYVAHTGADQVDVIDCSTNRWLRSLPGHPGVAGVLVDSGADRLFTSDRGANRVGVYRCSDEEPLGQVDVGAHPNGLAFDPVRGYLYSFNLGEPFGQNCTASVVDLGSAQVIATIRLPGRPRWAAYDAATDRVFVNIRDPAVILVITSAELEVAGAIEVPAEGPHGLWIDGDRLYCAADGNALVVLNRDTGAVVAHLRLPGVPDVVMHDPALRHLYVAIGEPGVIGVVDTDRLEIIETVATEPGAHTLGIDPDRHAIYAFLPASSRAAVYLDR
jgi:DNA-binding beta-propeller fold protein YncE